MQQYRVKNGVKVRRIATYPNRYSDGKIHLEAYIKTDNFYILTHGGKGWVPVCRPDGKFHSEVVEPSSPLLVSCKVCLRSGYVPKQWVPEEETKMTEPVDPKEAVERLNTEFELEEDYELLPDEDE